MKFGNCCWLQQEGIECFAAQEAYFITKKEKEVSFCVPTHHIVYRGDTLGGVNLTVKISSPAPEVLRVQTFHYMGVQKKAPEFELNLEPQTLRTEEDEGQISIFSGNFGVKITKNPWSMTFLRNGKTVTKSAGRDQAYMRKDWTGLAYEKDPEGKAYMRQQLGLSVGEQVYGLGERFSAFTKNGQSVDIWNEDWCTSTEKSLKTVSYTDLTLPTTILV